jgi:predicted O-methyltransferase YrrM
MIEPILKEAVEWRVPIWAPAVSNALDRAAARLSVNAKVLEIGYNSGMMSCYMAAQYRWNVVGYDIDHSSRIKAEKTARHYNVEQMTDFRVCSPDNTLSIKGEYDAVFLKSVLYHISDKAFYRSWLDWIRSVIKDDGVVIAVENGKGGALDRLYRGQFKKSRWSNFLLFDSWAEQEFKRTFKNVDIKYFGRFSQFFTPFPKICSLVQVIENRFFPPTKNHCFVASIVAQK